MDDRDTIRRRMAADDASGRTEAYRLDMLARINRDATLHPRPAFAPAVNDNFMAGPTPPAAA